MFLTNQGKLSYIKDNFHPYFDIKITSNIVPDNVNNFVNFVLPIDKIDNYDFDSESGLKKFFNEDFNNVVFSADDNETLFKYEIYKKVYFIRMPSFFETIRMHILPKKYDASEEQSETPLLLFKLDKEEIDDNNFECSSEYERMEDKDSINLYYKEDEQLNSYGMYKFNIKNKTKNLHNLQINTGYSYNNTNPTDPMKIEHFTGIIDESDENGNPISPNELTEFNASLMDVNCDNNNNDYTNVSQAQKIVNSTLTWPNEIIPYDDEKGDHNIGFSNSHEIDTLYHKTIKYFNDDIYIEEDGYYLNNDWDEGKIRGI